MLNMSCSDKDSDLVECKYWLLQVKCMEIKRTLFNAFYGPEQDTLVRKGWCCFLYGYSGYYQISKALEVERTPL